MTDSEIVKETAKIINRAYTDKSIDFTGYGSQCDWIGYQIRQLYKDTGRLPEKEGQLSFGNDYQRGYKKFREQCSQNKSAPVIGQGKYCFR